MTHRDITAALAPIFHLPDGKQLQLRIKAVDHFVKNAPNVVLGQEKAIELLGRRIKGHFARMRNELSPLTILLPGPTGVGKTELMMMIAKDCDLPFFLIEGAEFSEEHSIARLVGSPSGYVGPDEGILFTFLEENSDGLIFIDELEKAHPAMNQHLMNFYDKGTLTAGDGRTITRSSMIIVGASNAGADRLHRDMDTREVKQVLAEYFVDRFGRPRPELIGRFEPIVMLAIEEPAFRQMLHKSLESLGTRSGFINANLRLVGFDEAASKLLYEKTRAVCEFNGKSLKRPSKMGFGNSTDDLTGGLFYDLRHVNRAIDDLAGDSLTQLAVEQYESGAYEARDTLIKVKLIGDPENEKIHAVPVND
jgi:ATP-dependent Clp protease ATP-binding subunit ClpA